MMSASTITAPATNDGVRYQRLRNVRRREMVAGADLLRRDRRHQSYLTRGSSSE